MNIAHIALGGCLRAPPVPYGLTADTGGHIAYLLSAAAAQAELSSVRRLTLYTRLFEDTALGAVQSRACEAVGAKISIERIATASSRYLEKEALAAELPSFTVGFLSHLEHSTNRPDVIHAHFADAAAVALAARQRFGVRVVYTPHALGYDKAAQCGDGDALGTRIAAERLALNEADAIVVSSGDEAARQLGLYAIENLAGRLHIVPPGAPIHAEGPRRLPALPFDDPLKPLVLAIARPMRKKNLIAVAEAFANSRLREIANLAILAGQHDAPSLGAEGREVLSALRSIVERSDLRGRAALPPSHDWEEVRALYHQAAQTGGVFVNPAWHEPFGLTLLEAAAAGLPVVATARGGAAELVAAIGHGLVVEPRDRQAIARACLAIIESETFRRRLSTAARHHREIYSWERYAGRSCEIYRAISQGTRVAA